MGINGLPPLLRDPKNLRHDLKDCRAGTVGIDCSILTVKFLHSDPMHIDRYHMLPRVPYGELLHNYFNRFISFFKKYSMPVIFVFDGQRNPLKKNTNDQRQLPIDNSMKQLQDIYKKNEKADQSHINMLRKKAITVDVELVSELIEYFKSSNITYLIAPVEADGQLVFMQKQNIINYILSEDSDLVVLGGTNIIQNLNMATGRCNILSTEDLTKALCTKYSADSLQPYDKIAVCIMMGSDYLPSNSRHIKNWLLLKKFDENGKLEWCNKSSESQVSIRSHRFIHFEVC